MKHNFDVLIIGGGPAGLMAAAALSEQSRLKVGVLSAKWGWQQKYDVKGSVYADILRLGIGSSIVSSQTKLGMFSRNESHIADFGRKQVCVLNLPKALRILRRRAKKCSFIQAEIVDGVRTEEGIVVKDLKKNEYFGKIAIDASGNAFVGAQIFGLPLPKATYQCVSALVRNCRFKDRDLMALYMDPRVCNSAFWLYPVSRDTVQVGVGEISIGRTVSQHYLRLALERSIQTISWFKDGFENACLDGRTVVFGHKPVIEPAEKMYADNLIFAGDSGGQGTALVGEGIRPALFGGLNAAQTVQAAFKKGDFQAESLKLADDLWWEQFGRHEIWYTLMRHFVVKNFSYEDWDEVVKRLQHLSNEDFWRVMTSQMNADDLVSIFDTKVVADIMKSGLRHMAEKAHLLRERSFISNFV